MFGGPGFPMPQGRPGEVYIAQAFPAQAYAADGLPPMATAVQYTPGMGQPVMGQPIYGYPLPLQGHTFAVPPVAGYGVAVANPEEAQPVKI